jgi:hypothetical protein
MLRRIRRIFLLLCILVALWFVFSGNPFAKAGREVVGFKQNLGVMQGTFSVSAGSFRYYKFNLPEGSKDVFVVGHFISAIGSRVPPKPRAESVPGPENYGSQVEVYLLSEGALAVWQQGQAARSQYESGRVTQGTLQQALPEGPGDYYLVFSNKFDHAASKKVTAAIQLHQKTWVPEWLRRNMTVN